MSDEHNYELEVRITKPMFVGVNLPGMDEFEVTSALDWWPDAPEGYFSPQTLFLSASASCVVLSMFKAAQAVHTEFTDVRVTATAEMCERDDLVWKFDRIFLHLDVTISDERHRSKVERVIDLAHKSCPVANSIGIPTELSYNIVVE
ncbi:MAG: OsmC family protein [Candidatus Thorarchaeota archaeon]